MDAHATKWELDTLFGLIEGLQVGVRALLASHPDKDSLEGHFDMLALESRAHVVASNRTDPALAALDDTLALLKSEIAGQYKGSTGTAFREASALRKRLTGE